MKRRIAIYGGSFDPFHLGHLVPTVRAQETFHFEAVHFVPAGSPPHKSVVPLTPVTHRLVMVAMATLPYENFFTSDDEVFAPQPTSSPAVLRWTLGFKVGIMRATMDLVFGPGSQPVAS